jgi:CO/xanthine dehydrogenase Mo-binding subunit
MTAVEYVGKSIRRADVVKKVTGALEYTIDSNMAGMLHGKLLRSTCARARIIRIDTSGARQMPGVVAVVTATELPQPVPLFGPVIADQPLLASGETRYHGEPVVIVLANDEDTAAEAVRQIRVEYEELPAVCTVADALKPGAPLLHPGGKRQDGRICDSNVGGEFEFKWGDVDKAKQECARMIDEVYSFPMVHHHALEPLSCIAYPAGNGVAIKSPIQSPFILQRVVAACLGLDLSAVRVIASDIGGGFGGRGYPKLEPLAAYLAMRTGRPVKISTSLDDGFFTVRRLAANVRMQSGFDCEGRIVFQDVNADFLMGAYADASTRIAQKAGFLGCGLYRTPNARIVARAIYSNTVVSTACRGFGMPQLVWAIESQMNAAGRLLKIDPLEIRLRNLPARGEVFVPGDTPADGDWREGLKQAASMVGWGNPKPSNVGRGIAIGVKNPIQASVSNAVAKLHSDGSVTVAVGTTEMGQGARTTFAQIAAEILKVPAEQIKVLMGDTAVAPFDLATAGSRSTVTMGNAVVAACEDLLTQLGAIARELGVIDGEEAVEFANATIRGRQGPISYGELLKQYLGPFQGEIVGRGMFRGKKDPRHPLGGLSDFWEVIFTSAEVEVNRSTGKVAVKKLVSVSEVGLAINPLQAEAQEEGSLIMGLGHTLMEEMVYDESGKLLNAGPLDYRIPTTMDIPVIETHLMENRDGPGPFGAKGIGEGPVIAVAPAIADAVYDAVGVVIKDLPLTPERVWRALNASGRDAKVEEARGPCIDREQI